MSEVLVSTVHPTLGALYWVYTSNAGCNYPDHYTITDWSEVVSVVLMALTLSLLATLYPAWKAARLDPVEALRMG